MTEIVRLKAAGTRADGLRKAAAIVRGWVPRGEGQLIDEVYARAILERLAHEGGPSEALGTQTEVSNERSME